MSKTYRITVETRDVFEDLEAPRETAFICEFELAGEPVSDTVWGVLAQYAKEGSFRVEPKIETNCEHCGHPVHVEMCQYPKCVSAYGIDQDGPCGCME